MSEIYWKAATEIYMLADTLVMGYVLYRLAVPFLENKKNAFLIGAAYSFMMVILYFMPFKMNNFAAYAIGILVSFAVMCMIDTRNYNQKIFIAVTFFSLRWLSAYIRTTLLYGADEFIICSEYMNTHPIIQFSMYVLDEMAGIILGLVIIGISVKYIIKAYVYKHQSMTIKEMLMLTAPSVTAMIGYAVIQNLHESYKENAFDVVSGMYRSLSLLYYVISIITIVVVIVLFQNIREKQSKELQNELLSVQLDSIKQHIEQVEKLYQDIRSIKHDMTNHILTLENLYANNNAGEAKEYMADLKAAFGEAVGEIKSANPITDVILSEWKDRTEKNKVAFKCDFHYPSNTNANAFDISVILNNALENALRAAKTSKKPYISVASYCRKNVYMIEITNSFDGKIQWNSETGLPITSKPQNEKHGYGLPNIRKVAEKYFGDIDISVNGENFRLSIMLMLEK